MNLRDLRELMEREKLDPNLHTALVRAVLDALPDMLSVVEAVAAMDPTYNYTVGRDVQELAVRLVEGGTVE